MGTLSPLGPLTVALFLAVPVAYLVLQLRALRHWDGIWRQAAQWSAWSMLGLVALSVVNYVTGAGGGLLLLLFALPVAAGYMLGLTAAHHLTYD